MKNYNRLFLLNLIALFFLSTSSLAINSISSLKLEKGNFRILLSGHEVEPVKLAAETLSKDFEKVMHYKPVISQTIDEANSIDIVIINEETGGSLLQPRFIRPLDGFESHRVYCSPDEKRIYLHGKDMRGAIYAIYTFSELFLEVPRCGIFLLGNRSIRNRWRYNRTLTIFRSHHKSGIVLGSLMIPICSVPGDACRKRTTNCGWRLCCG